MLRKLHRIVGLIFAPFFVITAATGAILLFRRQYSPSVKHDLLEWHHWEGLANYIGLLLAGALLFMAISGVALWGQVFFRKRRARRSARKDR
jgi:uncharacterized iron-regulated membrane protein